jgi:hypothetical protein
MDSKILSEVISLLTERVLSTEYAHMVKPWEMVFGGLVLPVLAEMEATLKDDQKYIELTSRYNREYIEDFFSTKTVEKVVTQTVVEKEIRFEVIEGSGTNRGPTLHGTVKAGGKFRRLKDTINKISRKVVELPPEGRDAINTWWNKVPDLSDVGFCQKIADEINLTSGIAPLSAAQVSGWVSWLCRITLMTEDEFNAYVDKAISNGKFSVRPILTNLRISQVANNKARLQEDRRIAAEAKARMKAERDSLVTV